MKVLLSERLGQSDRMSHDAKLLRKGCERDLSPLHTTAGNFSRAILKITAARDEPGWRSGLIAPPIVVAARAAQDATFRSPRDRWSLNLRGDRGFFFSDDRGQWAMTRTSPCVITDYLLQRGEDLARRGATGVALLISSWPAGGGADPR